MKRRRNPTSLSPNVAVFIIGFFIAIVFTVFAVNQPTELRKQAVEPDPISGGRKIVLTIGTFTDLNGVSSNQPFIYGSSEPGAHITVSILPDGFGGEIVANKVGNWSWKPEKALSPGSKTVAVVAKKDTGQGQLKQTFTVAAAKGGNPFGLVLLLMVLVALGFGGYVYYKSGKLSSSKSST